MRYTYRCPTHGAFDSDSRGDELWCPKCHTRSQRKWSFTVSAPFTAHLNPTTGTIINTPSQFKSELQQANDINEAAGRPSHLEPVDLRDKAALGVTSEGLPATYDRLLHEGRDSDAKRLRNLMEE